MTVVCVDKRLINRCNVLIRVASMAKSSENVVGVIIEFNVEIEQLSESHR